MQEICISLHVKKQMLIHEFSFADIAANSNIFRMDMYIGEQSVFHMNALLTFILYILSCNII